MKKLNQFFTYASLTSILIFRNAWLYTFFGPAARVLLLIIVFSRPLADIFSLTKIWTYIRKIVFIRQWLWIMTWVFALAHAVWYFISIKFSILDLFSNWAIWNPQTMLWLWIRAMIFMFPPLLTSNIFSMKKLWKYRKTIQRFTYPAFILTALHVGISRWHIQVSIVIISIYTIIRILAYKKVKLNLHLK